MRIEPEQIEAIVGALKGWGDLPRGYDPQDLVDEFDCKGDSGMTIAEAREQLLKRVDKGTKCPVCGQNAKKYRRKINSTMARTLITMYRHGGQDYIHTPSLPGDTHEASQLSWWELVEEEIVRRPDGGRAGYWRITKKGIDWVEHLSTVPKHAVVYDGVVLRLEGDLIDISEALGDHFNYRELMNA